MFFVFTMCAISGTQIVSPGKVPPVRQVVGVALVVVGLTLKGEGAVGVSAAQQPRLPFTPEAEASPAGGVFFVRRPRLPLSSISKA